jgi:hypothetical protein
MGQLFPTAQLDYMKQLVNGGIDELLPPTTDEVKQWNTFYLIYFNSEFSLNDGRRLPVSKCVKNPRPDEVSEALRTLGFRSICHHVSNC